MGTGPRLVISMIAGVAAFYSVYWVPSALFIPVEQYRLAFVLSLAAGIAAGRYVWRHTADATGGLIAYTVKGALIVGGIGFVGGFFGPMLLGGGNQGPLLGLLITGPLGCLLGAVGGLVQGLRGRRAV